MENVSVTQLNVLKEADRPNAQFYIDKIFDNFIQLKGDRLFGDDSAIIGGIALLANIPVTVVGQLRGNDYKEQMKYNFSMAYPEGYRKSLRLMKQAEKFNRPIICFVDTIGAYPGKQAEERGQIFAIANNLSEMMYLKVPIITVLIGNGGSGGALALCVADKIVILENAVLSAISPKAYAEIVWKDPSREQEAAKALKMNSVDLYKLGIVDKILPEYGGAHKSSEETAMSIKQYLIQQIKVLHMQNRSLLIKKRKKKFQKMGKCKDCKL